MRLGSTKRSPTTKSSNQRCAGIMRCRAGRSRSWHAFLVAGCVHRYRDAESATIRSIRHAGLVPGLTSLKRRCNYDVDGRSKPGHDEINMRVLPRIMTLFAKLSAYDERSARLAGIGADAAVDLHVLVRRRAGKFLVGTYSVGQLLWLRACAALLLLSPLIWRQRAAVPSPRAAVAAAVSRDAVDAGGRGVLPRHRLSAARRRHHLLSRRPDLRHRAVGDRAAASRSAGGAGPRS